jgi:thioredoxin 1
MATVTLTGENFESTLKEHDIVLVDFWASWCGPCRSFAPVFERVSQGNPDVVFGKVDTQAEQQLAGEAEVTSIPTVMAFRQGILLYSQPGAMSQKSLEQLLAAIREVDMDDVRRQLAAQSTQGAPDA